MVFGADSSVPTALQMGVLIQNEEDAAMSEKRYQISPIELVQWAEPLFGDEEAPAQGLSPELVTSYEAAAGFQLPAVLREYYLTCGRASLNEMLHPILTPDHDAKPFGGRLSFSPDYIEDAMLVFRKHNETGGEEQERLWALPKERWGEQLDNYLLFWRENQGCWYAGIRKQDLDQPDPPVYFNDQDTMYHWAPFGDSVSSFLLSTILEILEYEANAVTYSTIHPEHIRSILDEAGVDFQRLQEPYPFPGGRFCHTCLDPETNILYVYGEARKDCPADLKIFQPEEDDED